MDKHGVEFINQANEQLMDHAERWMRQEIRQIPNDEDCVEDGGVTHTAVTCLQA